MDCYAGSGSSLLSARRLMRRSIGIELESRFIEVINKELKVPQEIEPKSTLI